MKAIRPPTEANFGGWESLYYNESRFAGFSGKQKKSAERIPRSLSKIWITEA
jgi:hypothetical protein